MENKRDDIVAEQVVLPRNVRTSHRISKINDIVELESVVTDHPHSQLSTYKVIAEKEPHHFPIFTIGVSFLQIIIFYCFDFSDFALKLAYDPYRRHEIWRFFTPMLLHAGWSHLWGNVAMQLILGVFLEVVHGWKRIAVVYLASDFGGSLYRTVLKNTAYAVGASCGISGLIFSHLSTIILNWNEMESKFSRLFCVSVFIMHNIGSTVYKELYLGENLKISHAAHFGGAVTGLLVSFLVLKNFKPRPWKEIIKKICVGILLANFAIIFVVNVTLPDYFPPNEWNFDYNETYYNHQRTDA